MTEAAKPLYVRLPAAEAEQLDRAAFELQLPKRELVTRLVARGLPDLLRDATADRDPRRVVIETGGDQLAIGRHEFRPAEPPEVLTAEQVADLLQFGVADVLALAEAGDLPGRQLGDRWRFARRAVLDWLAAAA
jgi:excisionase family DNA binding protein